MKSFETPPSETKPEPSLEGLMESSEGEWAQLRACVQENYVKHGVPAELVQQFTVHNLQVEAFVQKFSALENFDDRAKEIAILGAILHDIAKGYGEFEEHGKVGGEMAKIILLDMGFSEDLVESVRLGIERHMGREGYPAYIAKKKYGDSFEYPAPKTKVGEMIYLCDILTQLTPEGSEKLLTIRRTDPDCIRADKEEVATKGISAEEAARQSVMSSAKKSYDLIMQESDYSLESIKEYAQEL